MEHNTLTETEIAPVEVPTHPIEPPRLVRAWELIERGFCQKILAVDKNGQRVEPDDKDATAWCVNGAMMAVYSKNLLSLSSPYYRLQAWARAQGYVGHVEWNNTPGRSKDEVVAVLFMLGI